MKKCKKCDNEFEPSKGLISYCSLECRNSRVWSEEDKIKKSNSAKNSEKMKIANKLIGENRIKKRIEKKCKICDKVMKLLPSHKNKLFCSVDCYNKSDNLKNNGGVRKGAGVGKSGWYNGYWCDSSWELAWVVYHIEHDITFERNKKGFDYLLKGKKYKYFPDFIMDSVYYEIKGYITEKSIEKIKQFDEKIVLIGKNEIKPMIDYTISKYGKDYINLYEDNPYNTLTKICPVCGEPCKEKNVVCSRICSGKLVKKNKTTH